jgi:hypothetical protein
MAVLDLAGASMLWPLHRRAPRPMVWDLLLEATDLLEPWIAEGRPRRAATQTEADVIERARRRKSLGGAGPGEMLMPYGRLGRLYRNGGPGRVGMRRASQRLQFCSGVVTGGY